MNNNDLNNEIIELPKLKEKKTVKQYIKELIPYVIILLVVIVIRTYFVTPIIVNGESMQPTLKGGELMILNKRASISRFDVVVVDIGSEKIIKRVIALPGESITCENGIIYVNDKKQEENYSKGVTPDFEKVKLDDDEYFVLGDNRENSLDSQELGPFKKDLIKGKTSFIIFPFTKFGNI